MISNPALGRSPGSVVLDTERGKHFDTAVVHADGDIDVELLLWSLQEVEVALRKQPGFGDPVELSCTDVTEGLLAPMAEVTVHCVSPGGLFSRTVK